MNNPSRALNLRELRSFQSVAELRSFTKASVHLRIAQPALSRQIKKLEEQLEVQLFVRTGRGLELTSAGELLFDRTQQLSRQMAQIVDEVRSEVGRISGTVTLGVPPAAGELFVPAVVARCREVYPGIRLNVVEDLNDALYELLMNQGVSLCILHNPQPRPGIHIEPLVVDHVHLVGPGVQKPGGVPPVYEGQGLHELPLILPALPHSRRLAVEQTCAERGWTLNVAMEASGFAVARAMAEAGLGYTVLTYYAVYQRIEQGRLSSTRIRDPELPWELCIGHRDEAVLPRPVAALKEVVHWAIHNLVDTGTWPGEPTYPEVARVA